MGSLSFHCGVMGVGKTEALIEQAGIFDYFGTCKYKVFSPIHCDVLESRNGESIVVDAVLDPELFAIKSWLSKEEVYLFIDEAQFLSKGQAQELREIAYDSAAKIECYGLITDFEGKFFEGSAELLRLADNIYKLDRSCEMCHTNNAILNMRCTDDSDLIELDKNKYKAVCQRCFRRFDG